MITEVTAKKAEVQLIKTFKLAVAKGPDLLDLCAAPKVAKPAPAKKPVAAKPATTRPATARPVAAAKPASKPVPSTATKTDTKSLNQYPGLMGDIQGDTIA